MNKYSIEQLQEIVSDDASFRSLMLRHPQFLNLCQTVVNKINANAVARPLPPIGQITAIQTAIFDNSHKTNRYSSKYAARFEVWTAPGEAINVAKKNFQFKADSFLYTPKNMLMNLKRIRGASITEAFAAEIEATCQALEPGDLIGLVASVGKGTTYHDGQLVVVPGGLRDEQTKMILKTDIAHQLAKFSAKAANGKPLGNKVILQSRYDVVGFNVGGTWATTSA